MILRQIIRLEHLIRRLQAWSLGLCLSKIDSSKLRELRDEAGIGNEDTSSWTFVEKVGNTISLILEVILIVAQARLVCMAKARGYFSNNTPMAKPGQTAKGAPRLHLHHLAQFGMPQQVRLPRIGKRSSAFSGDNVS